MAGTSKQGWMSIALGAILGAAAAVILGRNGAWVAIGIAVGIALGAVIFRRSPEASQLNQRVKTNK